MITNVMITTPHDTPALSHHGKWARATATWPLTQDVVAVAYFRGIEALARQYLNKG